MKQTLAVKLGQQLKMTPQLQQAIKLLQMSSLELTEEIENALEENPLLEREDEQEMFIGDNSPTDVPDLSGGSESDNNQIDKQLEALPELTGKTTENNDPEGDETFQNEWDDNFISGSQSLSHADNDLFDIYEQRASKETLKDHLLWQLELAKLAKSDFEIGVTIIGSINEDGFLEASVSELLESLPKETLCEVDLDETDVELVLQVIQSFEPLGVAARTLTESLVIQLKSFPESFHRRAEAIELLNQSSDLLAKKDYARIQKKHELSRAELGEAIALIQTLNPTPGCEFGNSESEYVIPDLVAKTKGGKWFVELNPQAVPKIRVSSFYEDMLRNSGKKAEKDYLKNNIQDAKWLVRSVQTRHDTLLKVGQKIAEVQQSFFDEGAVAMKPLILSEIADQVGLHESTVSRVTSKKYLATPSGLFELKHFFSSKLASDKGEETSSTAIRALIKKITDEENPQKPLSDSKIVGILKARNIDVARRTVAKYRESLSIPPSNERKRLI